MSHLIKHDGIIDHIEGRNLKVRILQTSACASCKVASHCHSTESKEKIIDVYDVKNIGNYSKGDPVTVVVSSKTGANAVLLAFVVPFVIMVGVVFLISRFTVEEPVMAMAGIISLIPYYILLYYYRERISRKFTFSIENYH
ncbi:MAG: SoxR reducing system RseC family protein [Prevotella sp.]|nr:SoxR reducing system RseC family protein [Prevotella sp.]